MVASNKQLPIRDQISNQRLKIWDLYCKSRVAETLENTSDKTFRDIYNAYNYTFNLWGGVEFVFWLQALVKKFRQYNSNIEPIYVFSSSTKTAGDKEKMRNLQSIAKQMGLDVTITNNRKPKPPVVRKKKSS